MSFLPFSFLFSSSLLVGSLISLSSNHWILIWVGLELNLISFIPLMFISNQDSENEGAMKYFLAQALGSSLILASGCNMYYSPHSMIPFYFSIFILLLGFLIKIGLPPCHYWFPSVMSALSWPMCFLLSTWQKVAPLFIFIYLFSSLPTFLLMIIILSASLVGGLGGLSQSLVKPLISYSSIGHMSWVMASSFSSFSLAFFYFFIYSLISSAIMLFMFVFNLSSISSLNSTSSVSLLMPIVFILLFLSLGGVPPFLGFISKWMVIQELSQISFMMSLILILGSLMNLLYYLNMMFIIFINKTLPTFFSFYWPSSQNISLVSLSSIPILAAPSLFFLFYAMTFLN